HLGPMAQDFYAAFSLGADDKHITTIDEGGVALAAIQGLNQKLEETRAESKAKDAQIREFKQQNDSLAQRLADLEATVKDLAERK
ncbi:MAG: peptidase S74, partial [Limisphaerales bacterium]